MRLVSLNLWGGMLYKPLMSYIKEQSALTDIFCFQEVFSSSPGAPETSSGARMFLFKELFDLLEGFAGVFEPRSRGFDFEGKVNAPVSHGLAVFARKEHKILSAKGEVVGDGGENVDKDVKAQIVNLLLSTGKSLAVINFHGLALPGSKLDTKERVSQSEKLAGIWASLKGAPKILCGDFNLMPETRSVEILSAEARNLISEYGIKNTRNNISWERFGNKQYFADFCFVDKIIVVKDFQVPYNEVSDHLPMILDFEI